MAARLVPPGCGGVVLHRGRVLLIGKRSNGEWRLPKGHAEPGETAAAAALREVAEETGFAELELGADLGRQAVEYSLGGVSVRRELCFFVIGLSGFRRCPRARREAQRFVVRWFEAEAALRTLTFAAERDFVQRALAAAGG